MERNIYKIGKELFITSEEEIQDCYVLTDLTKIVKVDKSNEELYHRFNCKKIILTTDLELQKDGVQAIDDEFLEWFVKNPSCEEVEVAKTNKLIDLYADKEEDKWEVKYHIYIPKEEPKQYSKVLSENGIELFFDEQGYLLKEEPDYTALLQPVGTRQETLEETDKTVFKKRLMKFKNDFPLYRGIQILESNIDKWIDENL